MTVWNWLIDVYSKCSGGISEDQYLNFENQPKENLLISTFEQRLVFRREFTFVEYSYVKKNMSLLNT